MTAQELHAGAGAVAIQVSGNYVTISVGATSLTLERKHRLSARRATTDLQLLLTDLRETDLVGRDDDLAALEVWLRADAEIAVRCLTGPGGAGKTRLAIELCERAEKANAWRAGFARQEGLAPAFWRVGPALLKVYADLGLTPLPLSTDGQIAQNTPPGTPPGTPLGTPDPEPRYLVCVAERNLTALIPLLPALAASPAERGMEDGAVPVSVRKVHAD